MASISSIGIGSGVLTSELIDDLVAVEREATDKRLNSQEELITTKVSELGTVSSLADNLMSAAKALTLSSSFQTSTASSTNESALTATASSLANAGTYTVETLALARAQTLATATYAEIDDVVGEGDLVFTFGDVDYDSIGGTFNFSPDAESSVRRVNINAGNHTLEGVRDAINDAGIGVRASIIDTGDGYRLLFEAKETGANNGFTIGVEAGSNGLDDFAFTDASTSMTQSVEGADAVMEVNGIQITRESNLVAGVINGVTLNLRQEGAGPVTLTVEPDVSAVIERMQTFVDAYNEMKSTINDLTAFDPDTGLGSVFTGDSAVRTLVNTSQRILGSLVDQLGGTTFRTLSEVGISTDGKTGLLDFDSSTFQTVLRSNAANLTTLFGVTGATTDTNIDYVGGTINTQTGEYDLIITQLATHAEFMGLAVGSGPFTIDKTNDNFQVAIDGTKSASINLTNGTYTGDELAELIQDAINQDEKIDVAGRSVTVSFNNAEQRFEIISGAIGSGSSIEFTDVDVSTALTLGLHKPGQGGLDSDTVETLKTSATLNAGLIVDGTNDQFRMSIGGVTSGLIQIPNTTYSDGESLANAIKAVLNNDSALALQDITAEVTFTGDIETGQLNVSFTQGNETLSFSTLSADAGLEASLGLVTGAGSFAATSALAVTDTLGSVLNGTAEFTIKANGVTSEPISVAINSDDGSDIAAALQAAIQADINLSATVSGAKTQAGTTDITAGAMDFTTDPRAFGLEYNGTRYELLVNTNGTAGSDLDGDGNTDFIDDTLQSIQDVLDATPGLAGNVNVIRSGDSIAFETVVAGAGESLNSYASGSGAKTDLGTSAITGTEDFSANATAFTLTFGGAAFAISLDQDPSASDDPAEVLSYIQSQVDAALTAEVGFDAGDIAVRLDASNQLYFETVAKNGVSTSSTRGTSAQIEITGVSDPLSIIPAEGPYSSGFDATGALEGFGVPAGTVIGQDLSQVSVVYEGGTDGGHFRIDFGNSVNFTIEQASGFAESSLGIVNTTSSSFGAAKGKNVEGTIGGYEATGVGERLTGAKGTPVEGLRLDVTGELLGVRGTVSFTRGVAQQLAKFLDDFLDAKGTLGLKQSGLQTELSEISEERTKLEARIELFQSRLASQFSYNDNLIQQLNSTQDFLSQQFEILSAIYTKKK